MLALCRHTARSAGSAQQLLRPLACRAASAVTTSSQVGAGGGGRSRQWPDEARVGVGIVALRPSPTSAGQTEVRATGPRDWLLAAAGWFLIPTCVHVLVCLSHIGTSDSAAFKLPARCCPVILAHRESAAHNQALPTQVTKKSDDRALPLSHSKSCKSQGTCYVPSQGMKYEPCLLHRRTRAGTACAAGQGAGQGALGVPRRQP